jgi:hypothetical protein
MSWQGEACNRRSQAQMGIVVTRRVPMLRGAALRSRVQGNFQARFWNSGGRGDSPADCSKLSDQNLVLSLGSLRLSVALSCPPNRLDPVDGQFAVV